MLWSELVYTHQLAEEGVAREEVAAAEDAQAEAKAATCCTGFCRRGQGSDAEEEEGKDVVGPHLVVPVAEDPAPGSSGAAQATVGKHSSATKLKAKLERVRVHLGSWVHKLLPMPMQAHLANLVGERMN